MQTNTTETSEVPIASVQDQMIDRVTTSQQEVLEAFDSAGQAVVEGLSRTQREIADFVAGRVRQDLETQGELLRCRTIDDLGRAQARFIRTAVGQYGDGLVRLMRLSAEMATRSRERRQG